MEPAGLEESAETASLVAAHVQLALARTALAEMSDDEFAAHDEELAAQLSALQAERERRLRARRPAAAPPPGAGDGAGEPAAAACSLWVGGCAAPAGCENLG